MKFEDLDKTDQLEVGAAFKAAYALLAMKTKSYYKANDKIGYLKFPDDGQQSIRPVGDKTENSGIN